MTSMLPVMNMHVDDAQCPIMSSRRYSFVSSTASASARAGRLVTRAMQFLDTNRDVAWRCLRDASILLHAELEGFGIGRRPQEGGSRRGGLAGWQAKRVLDFIEDNLGSKMAIRDIADLAALSTSHFSRAFKQTQGSSPLAYVMLRRVERAKLLMTSTPERLADIAMACGFTDQAHFSRYFRRVVGVSPGVWRRGWLPHSG